MATKKKTAAKPSTTRSAAKTKAKPASSKTKMWEVQVHRKALQRAVLMVEASSEEEAWQFADEMLDIDGIPNDEWETVEAANPEVSGVY